MAFPITGEGGVNLAPTAPGQIGAEGGVNLSPTAPGQIRAEGGADLAPSSDGVIVASGGASLFPDAPSSMETRHDVSSAIKIAGVVNAGDPVGDLLAFKELPDEGSDAWGNGYDPRWVRVFRVEGYWVIQLKADRVNLGTLVSDADDYDSPVGVATWNPGVGDLSGAVVVTAYTVPAPGQLVSEGGVNLSPTSVGQIASEGGVNLAPTSPGQVAAEGGANLGPTAPPQLVPASPH